MAVQITTNSGSNHASPYIDSLVWGNASWSTDEAVNVGFWTETSPVWGGDTSDAWSTSEIFAFEQVLDNYAAVSNLTFNTVTPSESTDISNTTDIIWYQGNDSEFDLSGVLGWHVVPDGLLITQGLGYWIGGYFNIDENSWNNLTQGSYGYITILHELGHAMGLAHPHDGGGDGDLFPGVILSYDTGDYALNQGIWTTMTYNDGWTVEPTNQYDYGWQMTLMAFDIAALQVIYGANNSYQTGDNTYTLSTSNGSGVGWECIWDAGGIDTISNAGSNQSSTINLNAAPLTGENAGGYVSWIGGITGGYTIANNVIIENAIGGDGDDVITGNDADNTIYDNAGTNTIDGGLGSDTLVINANYDNAISIVTSLTAVNDRVTTAENTAAANIDVVSNDSYNQTISNSSIFTNTVSNVEYVQFNDQTVSLNLTITAVSADNGSVIVNGDNTLTYTPNTDYSGTDTVYYTVSDGSNSSSAEAIITVGNGINATYIDTNLFTSPSEAHINYPFPSISIQGNIVNFNDVQWFTINLLAGNTTYFDIDFLDGDTLDDSVLSIYDSNLNLISISDDGAANNEGHHNYESLISLNTTQGGLYYIKVEGYDLDEIGSYTLNVSLDTNVTPHASTVNTIVSTLLLVEGFTNVVGLNTNWNNANNTLSISFASATNEDFNVMSHITPSQADYTEVVNFVLNEIGYSNISGLSTSWNTSSNILNFSFDSATLLYSETYISLTNYNATLDLDNYGNVTSFTSSAYTPTYGIWLSSSTNDLTTFEHAIIKDAFVAIDALENLSIATTTNDVATIALTALGYSNISGLSTSWNANTQTSTLSCSSMYSATDGWLYNVNIVVTTNSSGSITSYSSTGTSNGYPYSFNQYALDTTEVFVIEATNYALNTIDGINSNNTFTNMSATITFDNVGNLANFDATMNHSDVGVITENMGTLSNTAHQLIEAAYVDLINPDNDVIQLPSSSGVIDGGMGLDILTITDTFTDYTTGINTDDDGNVTVIITDASGNTTTITDVENFNFSDQNFDTAGLHANTEVRDLFYEMQSDGNGGYDQVYVMPELFLFPGNPEMEALYDYSYVMPTDNTVGDIIVGSSGNDFINGMGGGDGIIASDGNDVIDGGLGSNFLTGGNGDDVFYADGRGAHVAGWTREDDEVWTTVTDFNNGNSQATIWGYIDGTSTYTWEANQGAAGWEGITLRADLDGNGVVDTSFTFTGIDNQSELTLATNVVGDLGYILVS